MSNIIDLAAFQPETLDIKLKSGTVYSIPASVSVQTMTKIMNLQKKAQGITDPFDSFNILFNMAYEILSLDKTKEVTMDLVQNDFDDLILLRKFIAIFDEFMNNNIQSVIPNGANNNPKKNNIGPNSKTPSKK